MTAPRTRLLLLLVIPFVVGCVAPTTEAILGSWSNGDDGTDRELLFEEDDAGAFSYAIDVDGEPAQSGLYEVADDILVTIDGGEETMDDVLIWTVQFDASGAVTSGTQFADPIYQLTSSQMVLRSGSADGGRRTWSRSE